MGFRVHFTMYGLGDDHSQAAVESCSGFWGLICRVWGSGSSGQEFARGFGKVFTIWVLRFEVSGVMCRVKGVGSRV